MRYAILFDLDDTLFDCTSQLVMPAHRGAVTAMIAAGLTAQPGEALKKRLELFAASPREDVNKLLAEFYECKDPGVAQAGHDAFYKRDIRPIQPEDGVPGMLERLRDRYGIFLVTAGDPETQAKKVEMLALQKHFDEIVYVDSSKGETKEDAFRGLLERHQLAPADCIAIGNRVDSEIRAGKSLGIRTIWVRRGEYAHLEPDGPEETPDHTVETISVLPALIRSIEPI